MRRGLSGVLGQNKRVGFLAVLQLFVLVFNALVREDLRRNFLVAHALPHNRIVLAALDFVDDVLGETTIHLSTPLGFRKTSHDIPRHPKTASTFQYFPRHPKTASRRPASNDFPRRLQDSP